MSDADELGAGSSDSGEAPAAAPPAAQAASALREDQIQNAVAFLSHPKVRSSPAASKREFLQRKGLNEAEIDEAFRRVPEPAAAAAQTPAAAAGAAAAAGTPPAPAAPSALQSTLQHLQPAAQYGAPQLPPQQLQQQPGAMVLHQQPPGVRWTQVVLGASFLAAGAYAAKSLLWPYLEDAYFTWRGHVRPPPRPRRINGGAEGEAPGADATRAVAEAIQAQTAELRTSIDSIKALVSTLESQATASQQAAQQAAAAAGAPGAAGGSGGGSGGEGSLTVSELRQELRSFAEALQEIASPKPAGSVGTAATGAASGRLESDISEIKSLLAEILRSPSSTSHRTPGRDGPGGLLGEEESGTPQSVSSAVKRPRGGGGAHGTGSSGSAAALAAGHAESSGSPAAAPAAGPAGTADGPAAELPAAAAAAAAAEPASTPQQQAAAEPPAATPARGDELCLGATAAANNDEVDAAAAEAAGEAASRQPAGTPISGAAAAGAAAAAVADLPPHPASYMDVLEMLERGQTPPGIRTDINDKPPNPNAAPAEPKLKPRPKPWEQRGSGSGSSSGAAGAGGSGAMWRTAGSVGSSSGGSLNLLSAAPTSDGPAGASAVPATAGAAAAAAASPMLPTDGPAGRLAAEQSGSQLPAPSPVRAPSPAEEAAQQEVAADERQQQQAAAAAAGAPGGGNGSGSSSFHSPPRRAASIYEAVAPAPESPHVIAGKLSPSRADSLGSRGSSSAAFGEGRQPQALSDSFTAALLAAQERAAAAAAAMGGGAGGSGSGGGGVDSPIREGSGIGRPISRNWRPPPIPAPTLSGGSRSGGVPAAGPGRPSPSTAAAGAAPAEVAFDAGTTAESGVPAAAAAAAAPAPVAGASGAFAAGGQGRGGASASAASLGEDFASA